MVAAQKVAGAVVVHGCLLLVWPVVLCVVDAFAQPVLLPVDLRLFFVGEVAAIRLALGANLFVEIGLLVLQMRGFLGSQRAILDAVSNARLLILLALLDASRRRIVRTPNSSRPHQKSRGRYP